MTRLYVAMALAGIATTMLGPLLPSFAQRGGMSDAQSGLLFTAQFLASVASSAVAGPLGARRGYGALIAAGLLITGLGVAGCAIASPALLPVPVALYGCGLGLMTPAANLLAAASSPAGSAAAVMWINLSWSIGAVMAPLCVAGFRGAFLWILAACVMATGVAMAAGRDGAPTPEPRKPVLGAGTLTLLTAALLFLYTGTEASLGGWLSSYALRAEDTRGLWAVLPSIFWGAILLGRVASPPMLARLTSRGLALLGIAVALAGAALLVTGYGPIAIVGATALTGLGMSPVFPVVVAQYADRSGGNQAAGLIFSAAGLGGAVVPPLVGMLAASSGSLRVGLAVVLVWMAGMMGLEWRLGR
jgi:fucose permease